METYGKILLIAMPVFLFLVLLEKWYGIFKGKDTVRNMDMISSLSSGVTNVVKDVLGLSVIIIGYPWLLKKLAVIHVENSLLTYIIAFLALDFAGYWIHRIQHEYNLFWNNHIIHHSSEEYNLACALRQSISEILKLFAVFLLPAALLGVPTMVIAIVAPLQLFAQFWYHTQHIHKMGFLEKIIVTPSHHRVHHAINPEYLDKNYSQIFIIWDKLFGTFQAELAEIKPVYGITRPVQTWNPIKINFLHIWLLCKDAWRTRSWKDKLRIWLMPTGWRPADVVEKYPVHKINDVFHFEKYNPKSSRALEVWSYLQLLILLLFISYLFANISLINNLNSNYIYGYGAFIFLMVYANTDLMDRNRSAIIGEVMKNGLGLYFLYSQNDWFGASQYFAGIKIIVAVYFILSTIVSAWFVLKHAQEDKSISQNNETVFNFSS
jgi:alkylglycerol monooxygenase